MKQDIVLSELIGLIYEAAGDIAAWPTLLDGVFNYIQQAGGMPGLVGAGNMQLLDSLAAHFVRAHDMQRQIAEADAEVDLFEALMNRLPLGMALMDGHGQAITLNRTMSTLLASDGPLVQVSGRLVSRPPTALSQALARIGGPEGGETVLQLGGAGGLSVWLNRLPHPASDADLSRRRILLLAASPSARALSVSGLSQFFGLTAAEAQLTQQLALGCSIEDYAQTKGVSINTLKTHLKRVFAKVGVRRQAELVQAIYASPLWLTHGNGEPGAPGAMPNAMPDSQATAGPMLRLPSGRQMAFSDSGPRDGLPVFFMHAIVGSRDLRHPDDGLLHEACVRWIIAERPGFGDSESQEKRTVEDWPADMAALADHLGIPRFVVLGYSAGTPYAFATARALPERVRALEVWAAMPPLEGLNHLRDYDRMSRAVVAVAAYTPALLPSMLRVAAKSIHRNPHRFMEISLRHITASERQAFADPRLRQRYMAGYMAAVRHGEQVLAQEVALFCQSWGFDPAEVCCPVHFWHGERDPLIATSGVERLMAKIPGARLTVLPDVGHHLIYVHWRDMLQACRAAADGR